jgi:spore coat polysaccharide biosynthesis protein SpsF
MTDPTALIVLQARVGSQRLPGKVLAPVGGQPLLAYCIRRLQAAAIGPVIVATTSLCEDRALLTLAGELGADVHTGPVDDVLARFAGALADRPHPWIIRATGDNPFVDIDAPGRVLKALLSGADYAVEEALPLGAAVEGIRRDVLLQAQQEASTVYDREHVTPWVRRASGVVRVTPAAPSLVRAPDLRFTVDTPDDLAFARRLADLAAAEGLDPCLTPLAQLIALARRLPSREVA